MGVCFIISCLFGWFKGLCSGFFAYEGRRIRVGFFAGGISSRVF